MEQIKKPGYALLFILLTTSALTLYCLALFRSSFHTISISSLQTKRMQEEYLVQGLLEYGIAFCIENKEKLFLKDDMVKRDIILVAKRWPPSGDTFFSGRLTIQRIASKSCKIMAQLFLDEKIISVASCHVLPLHTENNEVDGLRVAKWICSKNN